MTDPKKLHIEIFDEFDGLQSSQYPDVSQNTANSNAAKAEKRDLALEIEALKAENERLWAKVRELLLKTGEI